MRPKVTILFMDIVGFTSMSKMVDPNAVLTFLNQVCVDERGLIGWGRAGEV